MPDQVVEAPESQEAPAQVEQTTETPAPEAEGQNPEPEKTPDELEAEKAKFEQQKLSRRERQRQRDREEFARREGELAAENRMLREQLQGRAQPKVDAAPKREDFESYEDFLRADAKYEARQLVEAELKKDRESRQGQERQSKEARESGERAKNWQKREAEFIKATPDYEEVVGEYLDGGALNGMDQRAREAIVESEFGPQLMHYLATHPEEAERLSQISPNRQIAELGKLETKLEKAPPKPSAAPAPASPIRSARSTGKDVTKMSAKELEADMKARGSKWVR